MGILKLQFCSPGAYQTVCMRVLGLLPTIVGRRRSFNNLASSYVNRTQIAQKTKIFFL